MEKLKIFLSYSHKDRVLANSIKEGLDNVGFDAFLAHNSIETSLEWEKEILEKLKKCDLFIPILTNYFRESKWTDQEIGIAYALNKKFISLIVENISPYGFIGKWQGLKFNTEEKWRKIEISKLISKIILLFPKESKTTILNFIKTISSFDQANSSFVLLDKFHPFTDKEINQIVRDSINNPNVEKGYNSRSLLENWLERYGKKLDMNLRIRINKEWGFEEERARKLLGGKSEWGGPTLYGTPEEKLEQLRGYGGEIIDKMREELRKEIEEEKNQ